MLKEFKTTDYEIFKTKKTFKTSLEQQVAKREEKKKKEKEEAIDRNIKMKKSKKFNDKNEKILEKYKENFLMDNENFNLKSIQEFLDNKSGMKKETVEIINTLSFLEAQENKLRIILEKMKKDELNRLSKEFITNDYERRFKTTRHQVISAMIGEDNTMHEITKIQRDQKVKFK
jgi:hypothetical protein